MKVHSIFEDDYHITHKKQILEFCKNAFIEKSEPGHVNMWHSDWENVNSTFPYLLYNSNRFANGNGDMFVLFDEEDSIVAVSGVNISDFDSNVALGGVRTWLNKEYRGQFVVGRYLLPEHLRWAKEHGLKTVALTFNDYNKRLIPYFARSGFGIRKKRNINSMFYNGQHILDFPVTINYTKQWVIYHKIDENYVPDWESIKYT